MPETTNPKWSSFSVSSVNNLEIAIFAPTPTAWKPTRSWLLTMPGLTTEKICASPEESKPQIKTGVRLEAPSCLCYTKEKVLIERSKIGSPSDEQSLHVSKRGESTRSLDQLLASFLYAALKQAIILIPDFGKSGFWLIICSAPETTLSAKVGSPAKSAYHSVSPIRLNFLAPVSYCIAPEPEESSSLPP